MWNCSFLILITRLSCTRRLPCGLRGEAAAVGDGAVGPSEIGPVKYRRIQILNPLSLWIFIDLVMYKTSDEN